jgi:hypothetical protein
MALEALELTNGANGHAGLAGPDESKAVTADLAELRLADLDVRGFTIHQFALLTNMICRPQN